MQIILFFNKYITEEVSRYNIPNGRLLQHGGNSYVTAHDRIYIVNEAKNGLFPTLMPATKLAAPCWDTAEVKRVLEAYFDLKQEKSGDVE